MPHTTKSEGSSSSKLVLQLFNTGLLMATLGAVSYVGQTTMESARSLAGVNAKLEELTKNQNGFKEDLNHVTDKLDGIDRRVTRLETKSGL